MLRALTVLLLSSTEMRANVVTESVGSRSHAGEVALQADKRAVAARSKPRLVSIRQMVLCTLAIQNAGQMLTMRYSRMPAQPKYLSSTAVVVAEVVKITVSFAVLLHQYGPAAIGQVWRSVFVAWHDTALVSLPALLYLVQNNLLYVAASHLDAATCQVAYQLKLLTTAFFTVTLLKRQISLRRWLSLGVLFVGVMLVQAPAATASRGHDSQSAVIGIAAVGGACVLSGLSGVWLERIIKRTTEVPIWLRNIQLGLLSLIIGLCSVFWLDGAVVKSGGFFQGYTWITAFVVLQVSCGGLLVALVMRYADNVVKGFATSLSIVLSSLVSWFIPAFDFNPSGAFIMGSTLVILATVLYNSNSLSTVEKIVPRPPTPAAPLVAAAGSSISGVRDIFVAKSEHDKV